MLAGKFTPPWLCAESLRGWPRLSSCCSLGTNSRPTGSFPLFRPLTSPLCPGHLAFWQFLCLLLPGLHSSPRLLVTQSLHTHPCDGPSPESPCHLEYSCRKCPRSQAGSLSTKGSLPTQWLTAHIHYHSLPDPCHLLCITLNIFP